MMGMESLLPVVVLLPFILVLLVVGSGRRAAADHQARRLAAIERKLDLVIAHLGLREDEPDAVMLELLAGRKVHAVKAYREATGASLLEAKNAVDAIARQHGIA